MNIYPRIARWALVGLGIAAAWFALAASAAPSASLVDPVARLEYGQAKGQATLLLKIDGLDADGLAKSDLIGPVRELQQPDKPKVGEKVSARELTPRAVRSRTWLLTIEVDGLQPNMSQPRWLIFSLAGDDVTLGYTLTNSATVPFSWTVKAQPTLAIEPGAPIPLSISMGPVPATGVRVLQTALVEKESKKMISPKGLVLCQSAATACTQTILSLAPNTPAEMWLWGVDRPGQFEGSVTIASVEKPAGDTISMTVYATSLCYQIGGVVAIFCGILLAWFGTVFLRNRLNRDQLVLPAAALSVDLKTLEDVVARLKPLATNVALKIGDIQRALDEVFLETKGLPSPFQLPWSASANATAIEGYRQHLQQQRDWIAALQVIVHGGIERANLLRASHPVATQLVLIDTTVSDLDRLAVGDTAPALDALRLAVAKRIDDLEVALRPSAPVAAPMPPQPRAQVVRTPEEIRLEIFRFGVASWAFLAFVTTIAGAYVLIFSSAGAGFGTPRDFVVCLLWGLGLPAGAQLMQSTTGTIATTFGVTK